MKTVIAGLVVAACTVALVGCASSGARNASAPAASPVVQEHDAQLVSEVRDQIAQSTAPATIDVTAAQGKIELRGTVADADEARRAVKSALAVDGVRGVVNDLKVGEPVTAAVSSTN